MAVTYNKTNWVNDVTPLDANNMNNIETGIESLVNEVNAEVAKIANKADINNPLSLSEVYRKSNGFLIHDYTSDTGEEKYILSPKDGVVLDDTNTGKSKIPSS